VHGLANIFVGDMSAYDDDVWGYTTAAAAVAGATAAMRALEEAERHSAAQVQPSTRSSLVLSAVASVAIGLLWVAMLLCCANRVQPPTRP